MVLGPAFLVTNKAPPLHKQDSNRYNHDNSDGGDDSDNDCLDFTPYTSNQNEKEESSVNSGSESSMGDIKKDTSGRNMRHQHNHNNMFGGMNKYFVAPQQNQHRKRVPKHQEKLLEQKNSFFNDSFVTDESEIEGDLDTPYSSGAEESFFGDGLSDSEHTTREDVLGWDAMLDKRPSAGPGLYNQDGVDDCETETEEEEQSGSEEEDGDETPRQKVDPFACIQVVPGNATSKTYANKKDNALNAFVVANTKQTSDHNNRSETKTLPLQMQQRQQQYQLVHDIKHLPSKPMQSQQNQQTNEATPVPPTKESAHRPIRRSSISDRRQKVSRTGSGRGKILASSSRNNTMEDSLRNQSARENNASSRRLSSRRLSSSRMDGSTKDFTRRTSAMMADRSTGTASTGSSLGSGSGYVNNSEDKNNSTAVEKEIRSDRDHTRRKSRAQTRMAKSLSSGSSRRHMKDNMKNSSRPILDASNSGNSSKRQGTKLRDGSNSHACRLDKSASSNRMGNSRQHHLSDRHRMDRSSSKRLDCTNDSSRRHLERDSSRMSSLDQSNTHVPLRLHDSSRNDRGRSTEGGVISQRRRSHSRNRMTKAHSRSRMASDNGADASETLFRGESSRHLSSGSNSRQLGPKTPRASSLRNFNDDIRGSDGNSQRHLEPETPKRASSRRSLNDGSNGGNSGLRRVSETVSSSNRNNDTLAPKTPGRNSSRNSLSDAFWIPRGTAKSSRQNSETRGNSLSYHISATSAPIIPASTSNERPTGGPNRTNRRSAEPKTPKRSFSDDDGAAIQDESLRTMDCKTPNRTKSHDDSLIRSESERNPACTAYPETPGRASRRRYSETIRSESVRGLLKTPSSRRHSIVVPRQRVSAGGSCAVYGVGTNLTTNRESTASSTASGAVDDGSIIKANDAVERACSLMESHFPARTLIDKYTRTDAESIETASSEGAESITAGTVGADTVKAVIHPNSSDDGKYNGMNDNECQSYNYDHDNDESGQQNNEKEAKRIDEATNINMGNKNSKKEKIGRRRSDNAFNLEHEGSNRRLARRKYGITARGADGATRRNIERSSSEPTEKLQDIFQQRKKKEIEQEASNSLQ